LVLCLVLFGCSYSPNAVQIEIDSSFSQDKRELILQSLSDWSVKTNGGFGISTISYPDGMSTDTEYNVIKFYNTNVMLEFVPGSTLHEAGLTVTKYMTPGHLSYHIEAVINIWGGETNDLFAVVARHELGHAMNLGHYCNDKEAKLSWTNCQVTVPTPEVSIMYPEISPATEVEPVDVFRFCELWNCPE